MNDITVNLDLRYSPNNNNSYKTTGLNKTNTRQNKDRDDEVTDHQGAPNYRLYTANRNISDTQTRGCSRDHVLSSRSANGKSSNRSNLITDHQDATNHRVQPNDRNIENNWTRDHIWNQSSTSHNPNGISGVVGNDNSMVIGNPNWNSGSEREANGRNLNSNGAALARHHVTDNPTSVNPIPGMITDDFTLA